MKKIISTVIFLLLLVAGGFYYHGTKSKWFLKNRTIHFVSYGNERFEKSRERIAQEAKEAGWFDRIKVYTPQDISEYFEEHQGFIDVEKRGGGYWIWKPYIIKKELVRLKEGEFLVYADADCTIQKKGIESMVNYINTLEKSEFGVLSFEIDFPEKDWTKGDLADHLGIPLHSKPMNTGQIMSVVIILKKSPHAEKLVSDWLKLAVTEDYRLIDDSPSKTNAPSFVEHRHDQSIFSLLVKTQGGIVFRDEVQTRKMMEDPSEGISSPYPFFSTRKKE